MKEFERNQKVDALNLTDQQKLFSERYAGKYYCRIIFSKVVVKMAAKTPIGKLLRAVRRERMAIVEWKQLLGALQLPLEQFFQT